MGVPAAKSGVLIYFMKPAGSQADTNKGSAPAGSIKSESGIFVWLRPTPFENLLFLYSSKSP
jgi:hypothetical protein